jgi:hypothetical protein
MKAHSFNPFFWSPQMGAICITSPDSATNGFRPAGTYGSVLIEDNSIEGGNGAAISVTSAKSVVIRGNKIVNPLQIEPNDTGGKYHMDNHAVLWLSNCDDVRLERNRLVNPGPFMTSQIVCAHDVKHIAGKLEPNAKN